LLGLLVRGLVPRDWTLGDALMDGAQPAGVGWQFRRPGGVGLWPRSAMSTPETVVAAACQ
jgi:hypothetical protein